MEISDRLKKVVRDSGMKDVQLSKIMDESTSTISKYLNGRTPSVKFLVKFMEVFPEHDAYYIMTGKRVPQNLLNENSAIYGKEPLSIISSIEEQLIELKKLVTQK